MPVTFVLFTLWTPNKDFWTPYELRSPLMSWFEKFFAWYLFKNRPIVKKGVALFKMASVKKSKGATKKWLWWYRLMAKILITIIQVILHCLIPASLGISTKFTWIVVIKFCHPPIPSQPFLGHPLSFFTLGILTGLHLFLQLVCFWIDITSFCNLF